MIQLDFYDSQIVIKPEAQACSIHSIRQASERFVSHFYIFKITELTVSPKTE